MGNRKWLNILISISLFIFFQFKITLKVTIIKSWSKIYIFDRYLKFVEFISNFIQNNNFWFFEFFYKTSKISWKFVPMFRDHLFLTIETFGAKTRRLRIFFLFFTWRIYFRGVVLFSRDVSLLLHRKRRHNYLHYNFVPIGWRYLIVALNDRDFFLYETILKVILTKNWRWLIIEFKSSVIVQHN